MHTVNLNQQVYERAIASSAAVTTLFSALARADESTVARMTEDIAASTRIMSFFFENIADSDEAARVHMAHRLIHNAEEMVLRPIETMRLRAEVALMGIHSGMGDDAVVTDSDLEVHSRLAAEAQRLSIVLLTYLLEI